MMDLKKYMEEFHKTGAKLFIQLAAGMGRSMAITKPMILLLQHPVLGKLASPVADLDYITASASATPNRWYDEVKSRPMTHQGNSRSGRSLCKDLQAP